MTRYALVKGSEILSYGGPEVVNRDQSKLAAGKPRWLPVTEAGDPPAYDPAKQTLSGPVETVSGGAVVLSWALANLTIAQRKERMLAALADRRWQVETGGVTLGGLTIPTDRETQSIVARAVNAFGDGDITGPIDFKTPAGFVQIDEATMRAIKAAGAAHVQACFTREAVLSAEIASATTHAVLDAIDITAGWEFGA